jgi:fatty acid desaturase
MTNAKWIQRHDILHHSYTNDYKCDRDLSNGEPLIYYRSKINNFLTKYQAYYFIFVALISTHTVMFDTFCYTLKYDRINIVTPYLRSLRPRIITFKILHFLIVFSSLRESWWLPNIYLFAVSAVLSVLFTLSHNYEGVITEMASDKDGRKDWYKEQILGSSTWGGTLGCYLTGGLNFQIEHHLFPRMNPSHYPTIQPIVRRLCAKYGIHYRYFPSMLENLISTWKYMNTEGNII